MNIYGVKTIKNNKMFFTLFGEDYYIELQDHGLEKQKMSNPGLIELAKELGIKMVITNDSHYLRKEDADWHDTLLVSLLRSYDLIVQNGRRR